MSPNLPSILFSDRVSWNSALSWPSHWLALAIAGGYFFLVRDPILPPTRRARSSKQIPTYCRGGRYKYRRCRSVINVSLKARANCRPPTFCESWLKWNPVLTDQSIMYQIHNVLVSVPQIVPINAYESEMFGLCESTIYVHCGNRTEIARYQLWPLTWVLTNNLVPTFEFKTSTSKENWKWGVGITNKTSQSQFPMPILCIIFC